MLISEFDQPTRSSNRRTSLYESVSPLYGKQFVLGESLGRSLTEAKLTPDQINQLFSDLEASATAGGGNRTALGKITDAANLVKQAYDEIKELAQKSGPVEGFDAAFAKGAQSLGQSLGGDQGVMRYINKYREFAKAHPVAQKVVYGTLVLAIGVSAAMTGPAALAYKPAILGILKMTDKLLQGEKFSTAAIAGAETFAAGEIAKTVGGWVRGLVSTGSAAPVDVAASGGGAAGGAAGGSGVAADGNGTAQSGAEDSMINQKAASLRSQQTTMNDFAKKMGLVGNNHTAKFVGGVPVEVDGKPVPTNLYTPSQAGDIEAARQMATSMGNPDPLAGKPKVTGSVANITPAKDIPNTSPVPGSLLQPPAELQGSPQLSKAYNDLVAKIQSTPNYNPRNLPNDIQRFAANNKDAVVLSLSVQKAGGGNMQGFVNAITGTGVAGGSTSTSQFESQMNDLFMLAEAGMWDKIKSGAAAAGSAIAGSKAAQVIGQGVTKGIQKAAQVGSNLTNKVTADKLMAAWNKAGKPDDSEAIKKIMIDAGVDSQIIDAAFQKMGIEAGAPAAADIESFKPLVAKLNPQDRAKLIAALEKEVGGAAPAAPVSEEDHHPEEGYHIKHNSVYGKVLAQHGTAVLTNYEEARRLARKYNGKLLNPARDRYMIKMGSPARVNESSGHIPQNDAEAKDPRWSNALTVDIKPGEDARQAAKMGWNVKNGRPPKLDPSGKVYD
jgi:hypothetical protein